MKKVRLLVNTAYQGPHKEGDVISVPDDFADRWVKNKIAEPANEPDTKAEYEEPHVEESDITKLSAKELYALCKDKGIEAEAKKSKEYYLEKLAAVEE